MLSHLQNRVRLHLSVSLFTAFVAVGALSAAEKATGILEVEPSDPALLAKNTAIFIRVSDIDFSAALPPPPEVNSLAGRADLEAVRQAQEWRNPENIAWAKRIAKIDIFHFSDVLGTWFAAKNLPTLNKFIADLNTDIHGVSAAVKNKFSRARPYVVDPKIRPCVALPSNDSYPSGHTIRYFVFAHILSEIRPAQRAELFAFAHRAAWGRVWGGVHFPSDLVGGWLMADAIAVKLKQSEAFRARVEACRAEMESAEKRAK